MNGNDERNLPPLMIDDLAIYNTALTPTQVATIAKASYTNYVATPEPASMAMMGIGGLLVLRRRRNAQVS